MLKKIINYLRHSHGGIEDPLYVTDGKGPLWKVDMVTPLTLHEKIEALEEDLWRDRFAAVMSDQELEAFVEELDFFLPKNTLEETEMAEILKAKLGGRWEAYFTKLRAILSEKRPASDWAVEFRNGYLRFVYKPHLAASLEEAMSHIRAASRGSDAGKVIAAVYSFQKISDRLLDLLAHGEYAEQLRAGTGVATDPVTLFEKTWAHMTDSDGHFLVRLPTAEELAAHNQRVEAREAVMALIAGQADMEPSETPGSVIIRPKTIH